MGTLTSSSRRHSGRNLIAILAALVLLATACSQSNDPETWADAEADGNLRENFIRACAEANVEGGEVEFTGAQTSTYCTCAFEEIVEYYGGAVDAEVGLTDVATAVAGRDFAAFRELENDLRNDPNDIPADVEALFRGCTDQALS